MTIGLTMLCFGLFWTIFGYYLAEIWGDIKEESYAFNRIATAGLITAIIGAGVTLVSWVLQ